MTGKLPRTSRKGFVLSGQRANVLLFHGYTGSPYDLRPLGDFLASHDVAVTAPLLKGHGTKPSDLFSVVAEDWLLETTTILNQCDPQKPIVVGGLSMGALIAIILAARTHRISALLLFSVSLELTRSAQMLILAARLGLVDKNLSLPKLSGGSDIADLNARKKTPAYHEMPISGLVEFDRLRQLAISYLEAIRCPVFMAFGQHDSAINVRESHLRMLEHVQQPIVSKFYVRSKHVVTLDLDRNMLFGDVWNFLEGLQL